MTLAMALMFTGAFMLIQQDNKVTAFPQQYQGGNSLLDRYLVYRTMKVESLLG